MIDAEKINRCLQVLMQAATQARANLSPREQIAFHAGLRAAHAEEALTQGDNVRAQAHFAGLVELMQKLER